MFESDTDTEVIPKLTKYLYDTQCKEEQLPFSQLVEQVVFQLEGAFALVFKSSHYPGQLVATRRGSPLLVGIKSAHSIITDHIPVIFKDKKGGEEGRGRGGVRRGGVEKAGEEWRRQGERRQRRGVGRRGIKVG